MNKILFCLLCLVGTPLRAQVGTETHNIILITLDGFRWQELYRGGDPKILSNARFANSADSMKQFAGNTPEVRRRKLLPFFWSTMADDGQLYGNRDESNYMNCSNPYWFSYPGYHELLVGAVDRKVCSNGKFNNPNSTVLEFLNTQPEFNNSIAAFTTWDVFPYILRESSSGIPVNSGLEPVDWNRTLTENECKLNQNLLTQGHRTDSVTFHLAFEYLKNERPKVLYIALDETDDFAHHERYDHYLMAAHNADRWIEGLWRWLQQDPAYQGKTTLLITTDHGRGQNSRRNWRNHGRLTQGSSEIWMAVIGPDTPSGMGGNTPGQFYQKQIAATMAAILGLTYENAFAVGKPIQSAMRTRQLPVEQKEVLSGSISKVPNH